jgi:hypothetical protein
MATDLQSVVFDRSTISGEAELFYQICGFEAKSCVPLTLALSQWERESDGSRIKCGMTDNKVSLRFVMIVSEVELLSENYFVNGGEVERSRG